MEGAQLCRRGRASCLLARNGGCAGKKAQADSKVGAMFRILHMAADHGVDPVKRLLRDACGATLDAGPILMTGALPPQRRLILSGTVRLSLNRLLRLQWSFSRVSGIR